MPYGVDAVEQFQVVTSGGQAELGRALGGYINVVTKSGTNALRGTVYDFIRDDSFNAPNALSGHDASHGPAAVRWEPRWSDSRAIARSSSPTSNSACSIRPGSSPSSRTTCRSSTPGSWPYRLPGFTGQHGHLSESCPQHQRAGQTRSSGQRVGSPHDQVQPLSRDLGQLARRRRAERADGIRRPRQRGPLARIRQHLDAVVTDRQRDAGAVRLQRLEGAADRS